MMQLSPYLYFEGNCREAFQYYALVFGGSPHFVTNAESPWAGDTPAERMDQIAQARLAVHGFQLMASDVPSEYYEAPKGYSASLIVDTPEQAERLFAALSDGGEVIMPLDESAWAVRFGMLKDKFGIPWMIDCEKPQT